MSDENKMIRAKEVYNTLCTAIDNRDWNYEKLEEKLVVHFSVISLAILFGTVFWPYWTFADIKLHFALHNSCRTRKIGK